MRSKRFKDVCDLLAGERIVVLSRHQHHKGETVEIRIDPAIVLQLSPEELADAIQGYMFSNVLVTSVEAVGSPWVQDDCIFSVELVHVSKPQR